MIKDKLEKVIPKTINDCRKTDPVSEQILRWTDSVSFIGNIIITLNVIAGLVISIVLGVCIWDISDEYISWFWPCITGLAITTVNVLIIHIVFQFIKMLFSALASIVLNTRVTADVGLYTASKETRNENKENVVYHEVSKANEKGDVKKTERKSDAPIIADDTISTAEKEKIGAFMEEALECKRVSEIWEKWKACNFREHRVFVSIEKEIETALSIERMYGASGARIEKIVGKIRACLEEKDL